MKIIRIRGYAAPVRINEDPLLAIERLEIERRSNSPRKIPEYEYKEFFTSFSIVDENERVYHLEEDEEAGGPRGDVVFKEFNEDYVSINRPCWVQYTPYEASAEIYVLEQDLDEGKKILRDTLIKGMTEVIARCNKIVATLNSQP